MLLLFRALLPKPNHSFSFPSARDFTDNRSQTSAWGWQAGVGPKGDRAHFPGVTGSTVPCAELFATKNWQCVGWQRPCPPAKAGKRRGKGKMGGEHIGSSVSDSTAQSLARAAEATKACSKSYMHSLSISPSKADALWNALWGSSMGKQHFFLHSWNSKCTLCWSLGTFKESVFSIPLPVYTKMKESKLFQNILSAKIKYIIHLICIKKWKNENPILLRHSCKCTARLMAKSEREKERSMACREQKRKDF